ncbi:RNA polymerase I-specific transcription initiation factor RRN6-like protein [Aspergillus cavernicola]|uniref:RNA polymerase I-specific transcription initiation factor RRN6-like protein n=1 Tax=Aspergillus cavernicola TaxID=176166 RepID=A0ABR4HJ48_9EURO
MDEITSRPLQYGHIGKATYHPDTQSWSFSRSLAHPLRISYTGVTKTAVQSPTTSIQQSSTLKKSTLSRAYPELIAGFCFTPSETLSHTITATSEACNPLISTLLDFGGAADLDIDTSGRLAVPIVAFASGECGNTISLRPITDETVVLPQDTMAQLRVPTIGNEDAVEWLTDGAPIRQICFSRASEERATFMAARSSVTAIFRPSYRRSPVSVATHRNSNGMASCHQTSRLDPNFLVEISTSHTGGFAHADVKFNPWNQNQLAIVDEDGKWGIWELRNGYTQNKDNWVAARLTSGSLPWVGIEEGQGEGFQGRHDGWLAVEWVGTEHHVIVCDRRCCMLYRMEGTRAYSYSIEIGLKRKSEWILGIRRSTCNPSHVFILTTTRLIWLDVTPNLIPIEKDSRPSLYPRLSWRHFRDSDDTTLQLSSLVVNDDFYVILFSRLNRLVQAFYCPASPEHMTGSASAPDPFILDMPPSSDCAEDPEALSDDIQFSTLVLKEIASTAIGETYGDQGLSLLKVFAIDSRLRVHESLHSRPSTCNSDEEPSRGRDVLRVKHIRLAGQQKTAVRSRGDFIVDDWDESALRSRTILDRGIGSIAPLADSQFTLDYTQIYAIANGAISLLSQDGDEPSESSFQASVEELVHKISDPDLFDRSTSLTALEILQRTPVLDDIDQNAEDLRAFVSQFVPTNSVFGDKTHLLVQPFDPFSPRMVQLVKPVEVSKLDLVAIYDRLVNNWLVDLPPGIPGRARIAKEKAIRYFVADLVLAQIISTHISAEIENTASDNRPRPVSSGGGPIASLGTTDEQFSLEPLATQGLGSQASNATSQNSSTLGDYIFPDNQAETFPTFRALSFYTTFNRTEPISRVTERMLSHWKPGVDPASYALPSEESQLAARIKASKHRPRKVSQAMKNMSLDSSMPLPVSSPVPAVRDWGSQPDNSQPPAIRLQSSQVTDDLPMTQIERGAFGGREAGRKSGLKAKKKKRAAGF